MVAILPLRPSAAEQAHPTPSLQVPAEATEIIDTAISANQPISDEMLLHEIADGAEWAIEVLYHRYSRYAYSLAYHILHDSTTAEDIVQDAFLSIWRKASSYKRQQGNVRSWLQAIVHHRAIDCIRVAAHRDHQWTSLQPEGEQIHDMGQGEAWEEVWYEERRLLIHSVLAQLPTEQRQVIELGYFGGYTHAEMAELWHIPLGTVKGRMRLGLQKMKYLLVQHGVEAL